MDPALQEWLDLALRWMHAIAGIAWVGTSFFFNWLDARMSRLRCQLWILRWGRRAR